MTEQPKRKRIGKKKLIIIAVGIVVALVILEGFNDHFNAQVEQKEDQQAVSAAFHAGEVVGQKIEASQANH